MTYEQAMQAVSSGRRARRKAWPSDEYVCDGLVLEGTQQRVVRMLVQESNMPGSQAFEYVPRPEDEASEDWVALDI